MLPSPELAKYIDDLMKADLLEWRDFWFGWLIWSTKIVVCGLLWEAPELGYEIFAIPRKYEISKFKAVVHERHAPDWMKTAAFLGWFLIVAGVAGEWVTSVKMSNADAALQGFSTAQLVDTRKEADAAKVLASLNEWTAARLNVRAAELSKQAEDERQARLKIEGAWRGEVYQNRIKKNSLPSLECWPGFQSQCDTACLTPRAVVSQ